MSAKEEVREQTSEVRLPHSAPHSRFAVPTLLVPRSAFRVRPNSPTLRVPRSAFRVPLVLFVPLVVFLLPPSLHAKSDAPSYAAPVFDRFQGIIERMPFGKAPPPAPVAPAGLPAPQANQENQLAKQLAMVAVNHTPAGETTVGFIDNAQKPPHNYYLGVGEDADGFTIVAANYEDETATISKDGVEVTLQLGKGVVSGGGPALPGVIAAPPSMPIASLPSMPTVPRLDPATRAAARAAVIAAAARQETTDALTNHTERAALFPGSIESPDGAGTNRTAASYVERVKLRHDELVKYVQAEQQRADLRAKAEAQKISEAELTRSMRLINIDLIRQGINPVANVTLTSEEDAQLVKEGVLPAQ